MDPAEPASQEATRRGGWCLHCSLRSLIHSALSERPQGLARAQRVSGVGPSPFPLSCSRPTGAGAK